MNSDSNSISTLVWTFGLMSLFAVGGANSAIPEMHRIAVVFKMMMPLIKKRDAVGLVVLLAVFTAIGLLRLPLQAVLLIAIPLSLGITYFMRRRVNA